jgi:hypothetical protein
MGYLTFSALFTAAHIVAYMAAGAITLHLFYKPLHGGKDALYGAFLRDHDDPDERKRLGRVLLPSQLARGVLMSIVLYPVLGTLGDLSFGLQFAFLAGLMYIYTDLASAVPFSNTIEGVVYMKPTFIREAFWKTQGESAIYSVLMGTAGAMLLF